MSKIVRECAYPALKRGANENGHAVKCTLAKWDSAKYVSIIARVGTKL